MNSRKILYIGLMFLIFLLSVTVVYIIKPNYFINLLITYLPLCIFAIFLVRRSRKKILLFSIVTTLIFAIPLEVIAMNSNIWQVQTIFPRIFGVAPIENIIYAFINFFLILLFYEYFIDKDQTRKISTKWKLLVCIYIAFFLIVSYLFILRNSQLTLSYIAIGFAILIPCLMIFSQKPQLVKKVIVPTIFFAIVFFIHEVISMQLGHWWWPGEFITDSSLLGMKFPIEDVMVWYLFSTPALIAGYEFFMDDNK